MAKLSRIDWPAVELLFFSSDLTMREIAAKTGIPFGSIAARASRYKWQDRKDALKRGELPMEMRPTKAPASPESSQAPDSEGETNTGIPGNRVQSCAYKGRKTLSAAQMAENAQTVIANEADTYRKRMAKQARRLPDIMEQMSDNELLGNADRLEKLDKLNRRSLELDKEKAEQPLIQIHLLSELDEIPKSVVDVSTEALPLGDKTVSEPVSAADDSGDEPGE